MGPAAGVGPAGVAGALDAEQRLVGRHAPLSLRDRSPGLEHGRRDPLRVELAVPGGALELGHRLDLLRRLRRRRQRGRRAGTGAAVRREGVVHDWRRRFRPLRPVVRLYLRAVHGGCGGSLLVLRRRPIVVRFDLRTVHGESSGGSLVLRLNLRAVYGGRSLVVVLRLRPVLRFAPVFLLQRRGPAVLRRWHQCVAELENVDVEKALGRRRRRGR